MLKESSCLLSYPHRVADRFECKCYKPMHKLFCPTDSHHFAAEDDTIAKKQNNSIQNLTTIEVAATNS